MLCGGLLSRRVDTYASVRHKGVAIAVAVASSRRSEEHRMSDFAQARAYMVDCQVRPNDVTDLRIIAALSDVPRERFVDEAHASIAYIDRQIPLGGGRYLSEVTPFAKLLQIVKIQSGDRVLDVGAGSGYSTAVIAHLAGSVVGLEEDAALAAKATDTLKALGLANASVVTGKLSEGVKGQEFDVVFFSGAIADLPEAYAAQLRDGGRLIAVIGKDRTAQANVFVKACGKLDGRAVFNASLPCLPGFEKAAEFSFAL